MKHPYTLSTSKGEFREVDIITITAWYGDAPIQYVDGNQQYHPL